MKGVVQRFHCRACGQQAMVEHPLLYNDASVGKLMVQLDPSGEITPETLTLPIPGDLLRDVATRVVHRRDDMIEKILLNDAGLDDRVFEVVKLILVAQQRELADFSIYFEKIREDKLQLRLFSEQGATQASVARKLYDDLHRELAGRGWLQEQPAWGIVNHTFAMGWLQRMSQPR